MQFGRLMGTGLMVLGLLLISIQIGLFFGHKTETNPAPAPVPSSTPRELPIAGILGGVLLAGGAVVFLMARRRDEPDPAHAIK